MPDPLIVPDPSEVKRAAKAILSELELFDSEYGHLELGESYSLRRFKSAWKLTGGRIMWALCGLIAVGLGVYAGKSWESAYGRASAPATQLSVTTLFFSLWAGRLPCLHRIVERPHRKSTSRPRNFSSAL